jgi:hypothetical protein
MRSSFRSLLGIFSIALACSALYIDAGCGAAAANGPGLDWPDVVECGPTVGNLVGTVSRVLHEGARDQKTIGEAARAELEQLGLKHGTKTVACLVERLVHDWTSPGASAHPDRMAAAARGRDFLDDVGTKAILPDDGGPEASFRSQPAPEQPDPAALQLQADLAELQASVIAAGELPGASPRARALAEAVAASAPISSEP